MVSLLVSLWPIGAQSQPKALSRGYEAFMGFQNHGPCDEVSSSDRKILELSEEDLGKGGPDVTQHLGERAAAHASEGDYDKAALLYERALAVHEEHLQTDQEILADSLIRLALMYDAQCKFEASAPLYERAFAISAVADAANEGNRLFYLGRLGRLLNSDDLDAMTDSERLVHADTEELRRAMFQMGDVVLLHHYGDHKDKQKADYVYRSILEAFVSAFGPDGFPDQAIYQWVAYTFKVYGDLLEELGDAAPAAAMEARAWHFYELYAQTKTQ